MTKLKATEQTNRVQDVILRALNNNSLRKHIYTGTVPAKTIARRRRRNKIARVSRRVNRGRS